LSSASLLKSGIFFCLLIDRPLLAVHVARRNYPDQCTAFSQGERNMQKSCIIRFTKSMVTGFDLAMPCIFQHQKRVIEEDRFRLGLAHVVLLRILAGVAVVPVKACNLCPIDHDCILSAYTFSSIGCPWKKAF